MASFSQLFLDRGLRRATLLKLHPPQQANVVDGCPLFFWLLRHYTPEMCICNPEGQIEYSSLFVLPLATLFVILGMPLLTQHNPDIKWHARTVTNNLPFCSQVSLHSTTVESLLTLALHNISPKNRDLQMVFSKTRIFLLTGPGIVTCCLVPSLHVEKFTRSPWLRWRYMVEALKQGFIHPCSSLASSIFQVSALV